MAASTTGASPTWTTTSLMGSSLPPFFRNTPFPSQGETFPQTWEKGGSSAGASAASSGSSAAAVTHRAAARAVRASSTDSNFFITISSLY